MHAPDTGPPQRMVLHTARLDWQPSPSPSVWRKRLELSGPAEAGRVTSVVRYAPGSRFPSHPHPDGEEILVLGGVFSDEHGDYPTGTFLLHPEGFSHAPYSHEGCRLFVKLRQYPGMRRSQVTRRSGDLVWRDTGTGGVAESVLYEEHGYPERIRVLRLEPGAALVFEEPGGVEIFVLEGRLATDGGECLVTGSWGRYPPGTGLTVRSEAGARCYLKSGHLGPG